MSRNSVVNILCPIETINRELDFRLFFAAQCVRPGIRFVIGKQFSISDLIKEVRGGIYFGQNLVPLIRARPKQALVDSLNTMRSHDITLVMLDEEGGVMAGDEERWKKWLDYRIDIGGMKSHEHVCTWGDFQRDYYKSQDPPCRDNIVTTGHPRFDLYKPKYREYYAEEAGKWKEKYGDFVLVNTNFAWSNHSKGAFFSFTPSGHYEPKDPIKRVEHIGEWAHKNQVLSKMVALVARMSVEMPNLNIIVRPHPSENMKFYKAVFDEVPNVHVEHEGSVGPWLLASRALIHDGCTTAIEAHFCGVPILNYKSVIDERYDLELPNSLGLRCESEEKLLEALSAIMNGNSSISETRQTPAVASSLIHNFDHDSFETLIDYVQKVAEKAAPASANFDDALRRHQSYERVSTRLRHLKGTLGRGERSMVDKFYGFEYADLPGKFEKVKRITGKDVKFKMLSSRIFTVEA